MTRGKVEVSNVCEKTERVKIKVGKGLEAIFITFTEIDEEIEDISRFSYKESYNRSSQMVSDSSFAEAKRLAAGVIHDRFR